MSRAMQPVGGPCVICERRIRDARRALACAGCDVAFHRWCAKASAPVAYRETRERVGARCPRCGDDVVATTRRAEARDEANLRARLARGRREWLVAAAAGSSSHAALALVDVIVAGGAPGGADRLVFAWLLFAGAWWIPRMTPIGTGLLGVVGAVHALIAGAGVVYELSGRGGGVRGHVLLAYSVVALGGAGMAAMGLRLGTSAQAREFARATERRSHSRR